jgi:hypothetical protein
MANKNEKKKRPDHYLLQRTNFVAKWRACIFIFPFAEKFARIVTFILAPILNRQTNYYWLWKRN